ncbi:MAG: xylose isomerase protein [uncultured bacterium]|nr:MAG: xylose isomerase protein [uncultured bacterium]
MILGFATGDLYKTHDRLAPETFDLFRKMGCNAIELTIAEMDEAPRLLELDQKDFAGFRWISIHAPSFDRFDTNSVVKFRQTLEIFEQFCQKVKVNSIVFHPDQIGEWAIFENYTFPVLIENMDWRKEVGKYVDSMKEIFEKADAPMVLDLNHCYTNDPTMNLAKEMVENFKDRIFEIHLSGFEKGHDPLFLTQQMEILEAIPDKEMPIIIESECDSIEDAKKEFEFVRKYLNSK